MKNYWKWFKLTWLTPGIASIVSYGFLLLPLFNNLENHTITWKLWFMPIILLVLPLFFWQNSKEINGMAK